MADPAYTQDHPAPGLVIAQPRRGFRYGVEAFWVVGLALLEGPRPNSALDLGTGSGIMAALLAAHGVEATGVELRPEWGELWQHSLAASAPLPGLSLAQGDVREVQGSFDCVVSNPPFFTADSGPVASDPWRRAARTETVATLADFVAAACRALAPEGRAVLVVPAERGPEVLAAAMGGSCHGARVLQVGKKRWVVVIRRGGAAHANVEYLGERDQQVLDWVAAARAVVAPQSALE